MSAASIILRAQLNVLEKLGDTTPDNPADDCVGRFIIREMLGMARARVDIMSGLDALCTELRKEVSLHGFA